MTRRYSSSYASLNPFMNQVYFYILNWRLICGKSVQGLNPFMNQVYFYRGSILLTLPKP